MSHRDSWFGVELRHLAALAAVAREGSFRGAADRLGYVQSAVSQQIVQLEQLVGHRLIDRSRGSREIGVTAPGELLVGHAEEILAQVHAARADLVSGAELDRRPALRVGVFPGVVTGLLPGVLRGLATRAPELWVDPVESTSDAALVALVEQGRVDVAFGDLPLPSGTFRSREILRDPCVLLVPAGSEWAAGTTPAPTLDRLAEAPLVVLEGARSTAALETWFAAQGLTPNVVLRARTEAILRAFVAAGLGVAIVPRLAVECSDPAISAVELDGLAPERRVAIYWLDGRFYTGALEQFCEAAISAARELTLSRRSVVDAPVHDRAAPRAATVAVSVGAALAGAGTAPAPEPLPAPDDSGGHPARDAA
jgi:DNA-binding transcriptional LysR family regulator